MKVAMTPTTFGSLAWARKNQGRMTRSEMLTEALRGILAVARARLVRSAVLVGFRPRTVAAALADIPQPRTPLTSAAENALAGAPPWVLAHSMRTYLWGWLLGQRDGLRPEPELLLTAALLHDLGLVHTDGAACFALRGAEAARTVVVAAGKDEATADRVADAITMHLNVVAQGSPETLLLRAGAALDVVAARLDEIAPECRRDVLAAWPRTDFLENVTASLRAEAREHPGTRAEFLCRRLGFVRLAGKANRLF
jgi:HD superfamily phosphodiesterase